jgi:hypothetical protein
METNQAMPDMKPNQTRPKMEADHAKPDQEPNQTDHAMRRIARLLSVEVLYTGKSTVSVDVSRNLSICFKNIVVKER